MISVELKVSVKAFGAYRAIIYRGKKLFKDSGGKFESVISNSMAPKRKGQKEWHPEIINLILDYRKRHPKLGREKLKPTVNIFPWERGIKPVNG